MSRQLQRSVTSDDENWPVLRAGKGSAPTPLAKSGTTRTQLAGASGNSVDQPSTFSKALNGVTDQRLTSGAVNHSLGNPARPPLARAKPTPILPEAERVVKYSEIARRSTPPPSPTLQPIVGLPPPTLKANDTPATSAASSKRSKPSTQAIATDSFPPLSALPAPANKDQPPVRTPARKGSYAAATGTSTAKAASRPTVVTTGASSITSAPVVSESPVNVFSPKAKTISINISNSRSVTPPPAQPVQSLQTPKRKKRASAPDNNTLYPPQLEGRTRSASVSSVATSIAASSIITTSSRGPASSKTSICQTPICDDQEWKPKLTELAKGMSNKERSAWEKILRCDPKDTSKMKWKEFEKALKALKFKPQPRGGSETEYTPDPEYFGAKAQPISYHRPHPGADFTLGDLKAKSNSFRAQYPGAVAVLHEAWEVVDTRL